MFKKAESRYCILNTMWAQNLDHNKESMDVIPITDSQTVQAQTCIDTWAMSLTVSSA